MQPIQKKTFIQEDDFKITEERLRGIMFDPIGKDGLWRLLYANFKDATNETIHRYWWREYRFFTELAWDRVRVLHADDVVNHVFSKQLVMACILKFEPIDETLWYLGLRFPDKSDAISEYARIQKAVFESEMVVGVYKNQPQKVKDIVQEIVRLNQMKNPSLEVAEFKAKLETIFFSEIPDPQYIERLDIDKRESVATFFSFIHFIIGVKPEYIYGLVDEALNADRLAVEESESTSTAQSAEVDTVSEPEQEINTNYFVEIKNKIQDDLVSGNIADETEVFDRLQNYSEEYNDPRILDLYYYDEQAEKFVWNDELLTSS